MSDDAESSDDDEPDHDLDAGRIDLEEPDDDHDGMSAALRFALAAAAHEVASDAPAAADAAASGGAADGGGGSSGLPGKKNDENMPNVQEVNSNLTEPGDWPRSTVSGKRPTAGALPALARDTSSRRRDPQMSKS